MFNQSSNPRVWKSMDAIAKSLFRLIHNKPYQTITVSEVCSKAGITRKTFYRNFASLDDVIDFSVYARLRQYIVAQNPSSFSEYLLGFFQLCEAKKSNLALFYNQGIYDHFISGLLKYLPQSDYIHAFALRAGYSEETMPFFWRSLVGAESYLVSAWVCDGFKETPEELVKMSLLFFRTFAGVE
jgi:AcrR family transcriptional regulator